MSSFFLHAVPSSEMERLKQAYGPSALEQIAQCDGPASSTSSGLDLTQIIPVDPSIICKKLENGLTYYIKKNAKPEKHAELRLVVRAGSRDEMESERGLAHFVEHMLFRGTKHFPGNGIIDFLRSIGVGYGADLNATTTFDHTVYHFPLPLDKDSSLEQGLEILCDWAFHATFDDKYLDVERSAIIEEGRPGKRVRSLRKPFYKKLYGCSCHSDRMPIGKKKVVQLATSQQLREFYLRFYRPERMAVIVVGDLDPITAENLICKQFDYAPNLLPSIEPVQFSIARPAGRIYSFSYVPESKEVEFVLNIVQPRSSVQTVGQYKQTALDILYRLLFKKRLNEVIGHESVDFNACNIGATNKGLLKQTDVSFQTYIGHRAD